MHADPDKQQEELQRMLALKRHETPPERFFKGFSERVLDRVHSPEPDGPPTVWQRLGLDIDSKPVLVCASGIVVCGLLLVGLIVARRITPPTAPRLPDDQSHLVVAPPPTARPAPPEEEAAAPPAEPIAPLSEPVILPGSTAFSPPKLNPKPASTAAQRDQERKQ